MSDAVQLIKVYFVLARLDYSFCNILAVKS